MGILDEAIREHLELKRSHGADESELDGLQAEAFGPADRPDAVEAQTEVISPGSNLTTPAGEGDQLDKVFEATRVSGETGETELPSGDATKITGSTEATESPEATGEEATVAEHSVVPSPSAGPQPSRLPPNFPKPTRSTRPKRQRPGQCPPPTRTSTTSRVAMPETRSSASG